LVVVVDVAAVTTRALSKWRAPFEIYVYISGRLCARIALRSQRARASLSWPLSTSIRIYVFTHGVTARSWYLFC